MVERADVATKRKRCCENCVFAERLGGRWLRVILLRWPGLMICFHKAGAGGELSEVTPGETGYDGLMTSRTGGT